MKCVVVVRNPSMPDILFIWSDKDFQRHIAQTVADRGLVQPNDVEGSLDISILTQFFSPIIASHNILSSEMNCPYSSITCENDFIFVMKQFGQHVYLTVNGDGEETEQFLHKKLQVFHRIVEWFFGPVVEEMRPDSPSQRDSMWASIASVLLSWCDLYSREQSFLLEAVETLEVNQTLKELSIGLLETVLLKFRSAGDKNAVHAMLVTGAKLLALYSSRNASELHPADELLLITLAQTLYPAPSNSLQDPSSPGPEPPSQEGAASEKQVFGVPSDGEFMSAGEGCASDGSQYYSPVNSQDEHSPLLSDEAEDSEPLRALDETRSSTLSGVMPQNQGRDEISGSNFPTESTHEMPGDSHLKVKGQPNETSSQRSQTSQITNEKGELIAPRTLEVKGRRSLEKSLSGDTRAEGWCDPISGEESDMASIPSLDCTPNRRVSDPPNASTIWYTPVETSSALDRSGVKLETSEMPTASLLEQQSSPKSRQHSVKSDSNTSSAISSHGKHTPRASATSNIADDASKENLPDPSNEQNISDPLSKEGLAKPTRQRNLSVPLRSSTTKHRREKGSGSIEDGAQVTVFLKQASPHVPHIVYVVPILPSILLVVVTEMHTQVAIWVNNCLHRLSVLTEAVSRRSDSGEVLHKQSSVAKLDNDLKQLGNAVKKSRLQGIQQVHTELVKRWTIAKTCGLTTNQGSEVAMMPRLEAMLSEMARLLKSIFQRCYINRKMPLIRPPPRLQPVLSDVRSSMKESLALYHDYLVVKAERNITMTNYLADFPGLVHFVHVNRARDELTAPSINMTCDEEVGSKGNKLLKEKVWSMVESCYDQLQQGYVLETLQQGDFTFTYNLYFEDSNGALVHNRGVPKTMKTQVPGILAGRFFRQMAEHAFAGMLHADVTCYELFCIHLSVVPKSMVTAHVRRLRTILGSGETITLANLL